MNENFVNNKSINNIVNDNLQNYKLLILNYGGINLEKYCIKLQQGKITQENIVDFWKEVPRLLYGLKVLIGRRFVHHDIKIENIVYNEKEKRLNFIDFGLSKSLIDSINDINPINDINRRKKQQHFQYHFNFPPEIVFFKQKNFEDYQTKFYELPILEDLTKELYEILKKYTDKNILTDEYNSLFDDLPELNRNFVKLNEIIALNKTLIDEIDDIKEKNKIIKITKGIETIKNIKEEILDVEVNSTEFISVKETLKQYITPQTLLKWETDIKTYGHFPKDKYGEKMFNFFNLAYEKFDIYGLGLALMSVLERTPQLIDMTYNSKTNHNNNYNLTIFNKLYEILYSAMHPNWEKRLNIDEFTEQYSQLWDLNNNEFILKIKEIQEEEKKAEEEIRKAEEEEKKAEEEEYLSRKKASQQKASQQKASSSSTHKRQPKPIGGNKKTQKYKNKHKKQHK